MRVRKGNKYPTLRSLKQGTKFKVYGKDNVELVGVACTKRGSSRDFTIQGRNDTYSMSGDTTVEVLK